MDNYYDILGISRDATPEEIKKAYRKLAKKYHPDASAHQKNNSKFAEIQEAYSVLSDPEKRKMYHYYGHTAYRKSYYAQHASGRNHTHHDHTDSHHEGCGGCGGSCGGDHSSCGGDHGSCQGCHPSSSEQEQEIHRHVVRIAVWLEMEEIFHEVIKDVVLTERVPNPDPSRSPRFIEKKWEFQVKIPANSYEKQMLRLEDIIFSHTELIQHLQTAHPENLYTAIILLRDKPGYTRQNYHVCLDCQIDFHTLVLGGRIKVAALTGDLFIELPPGTSPEHSFRIPNHGLNYPPKIGGRGDLYLNFHVKIPQALTAAQKKALQMLRRAFESPEDMADS